MISRHFAAASLSLKVTRSFDAVRMLTMSCLAALADVVMRVKACDTPSPCSMHYSGRAQGKGGDRVIFVSVVCCTRCSLCVGCLLLARSPPPLVRFGT